MSSSAATDSAINSKAGQPEAEAEMSTDTTGTAATTNTMTTPAQPPRRDKLAAMASRAALPSGSSISAAAPAGSRGNSKFAAMASASANAAPIEEKEKIDETEAKEKYLQGLKEKLSRRKHILECLDRSEELGLKLLQLAHQTTRALEDLSCAPNISELSRTYRETLRELHPLLSTDTEHLIQPYQNHSTETKQSMYAARVEMRLAKERTQVLKVITELEKKERQEKDPEILGNSKKRPRE